MSDRILRYAILPVLVGSLLPLPPLPPNLKSCSVNQQPSAEVLPEMLPSDPSTTATRSDSVLPHSRGMPSSETVLSTSGTFDQIESNDDVGNSRVLRIVSLPGEDEDDDFVSPSHDGCGGGCLSSTYRPELAGRHLYPELAFALGFPVFQVNMVWGCGRMQTIS